MRLFALIGRGEGFLSVVVGAVICCALLMTIFALYWSGASRIRERMLLRVLGATGPDLVCIAWLEGAAIVSAGIAAGYVLGRLGALGAFRLLNEAASLSVGIPFTFRETEIPLTLLLIGSLAGLLPAWQNGRVSLEDLTD